MGCRFEVHRVFALDDRGLFAVSGEIKDGMVHTGMIASVPRSGGGGEGEFEERIHGVEFLDVPGAEGLPALTFHFRDPSKLRRWLTLGLEGRTLSVGF